MILVERVVSEKINKHNNNITTMMVLFCAPTVVFLLILIFRLKALVETYRLVRTNTGGALLTTTLTDKNNYTCARRISILNISYAHNCAYNRIWESRR